MKVTWIILDSVGAGELPDADLFGDAGANTLGHIIENFPDIQIPNLTSMGLGNIEGIKGLMKVEAPLANYGKSKELSRGKDTITGHWEMTGIITEEPFQVYPDGFSEEIINEFIMAAGIDGILGNKVASGTEILEELGDEHIKTGFPIIYTSADSVFQIAASEESFGLERLYDICHVARKILVGKNNVARVIARPFIKKDGKFVRTSNRHDYAVAPPEDNLLKYLENAGVDVISVGKINDIFSGSGIKKSIHTENNMDGVDKTILEMKALDKDKDALIFTNLVEFDSVWGHRRDVKGYKEGLEAFDRRLPEIINAMDDGDILIINSDHGCDPTFKGTDHTREYIPILIYKKGENKVKDFGTRDTFADIGETIREVFSDRHDIRCLPVGKSIL